MHMCYELQLGDLDNVTCNEGILVSEMFKIIIWSLIFFIILCLVPCHASYHRIISITFLIMIS